MSDFLKRLAEALTGQTAMDKSASARGAIPQVTESIYKPGRPSISPALGAPDLSGYSLGPRPGGPAYLQPFAGPHNAPYGSTPDLGENSVNQHTNPIPNIPLPDAPPLPAFGVQAATMPRPQMAPAPQASQPPMMGFDPNPPMSMEMQGVNQFAAQHPTGRNELERDYYAQLAQNPNGFDKPDWLKRFFG